MTKFLYSYAGKIIPRRKDGKLLYVGGHTRILAVNRSISFDELNVKFSKLCGYSVEFKCKLPEDYLDLLISIKCDEDLANIVDEYERFSVHTQHDTKVRVILLPIKSRTSEPSNNVSIVDQSHTKEYSSPSNVTFQLIKKHGGKYKGDCQCFGAPTSRYIDVKKDVYRLVLRPYGFVATN
ncbi:uncharacterized protein LOC124930126 [Impatiens glandulifera]|uniref:uncharacterized protein LOC124930126 n=1 Tax=Impatiens glandulifera TaxID=253017 RepID=UPI001FB05241|nr:uncharacterized protein LOC124930126 [Impatiens glandulifera]